MENWIIEMAAGVIGSGQASPGDRDRLGRSSPRPRGEHEATREARLATPGGGRAPQSKNREPPAFNHTRWQPNAAGAGPIAFDPIACAARSTFRPNWPWLYSKFETTCSMKHDTIAPATEDHLSLFASGCRGTKEEGDLGNPCSATQLPATQVLARITSFR